MDVFFSFSMIRYLSNLRSRTPRRTYTYYIALKATKCNFCVNRMTQFTLFLTTNWLFRPFDCCKPTCYGICLCIQNKYKLNKQTNKDFFKIKPTCVKYLCFGDMNTCAVTRTMDTYLCSNLHKGLFTNK